MIPLVPRQASSEDYPQFERLSADLGDGVAVPSAAEFAEVVAPNAILLEEVAAGAVVAFAHFVADGEWGHVVRIAVDREWRRSGVGRSLMAEVATRLRSRGCSRWWIEVAPSCVEGRAFFDAVGLHAVSPGAARMEGELPGT